ncbi:alpha/beta hydrolase [Gordonia sp. TBRC 11910]|uniref:Alpha/beta hydrolase n=1 Tax=Gordonia asplenii TaxID=2725283 RepID=A0A848KYE7_9ACTN|nr:alpha/beta hydrolase [Gordonia asplenii]NMO03157.1 alpha/beta hydrolase [Gordonia asplenii]
MPEPDPSTVRFDGPWHHFDVRANGVRFHAVEIDGRWLADRPLVLLLHGFGEFWWSWRHQLASLTEAGYRAVAVDLRGYGDTDKPPRGYDGWTLAGDANGLIRSLGHTEATLIGHADGGLVCWGTAILHPRMVTRIGVIASPHPRALRHSALFDAEQRNAFLGGFLHNQLPRLGERRLTRGDGAYIAQYFDERASERWKHSAEFSDVVARNRSAVQIPGVAYCSLEYRRWAFRSQFRPDGFRFMELMDQQLSIPVLALRGREDPFVIDSLMAASHNWASRLDYWQVAGAGHFAHQEQPTKANELILKWLAKE